MIIDLKSESPLIQTVFDGNIEKFQTLINNKKADANYQSSSSRIGLLHIAAYCSGVFFQKCIRSTRSGV